MSESFIALVDAAGAEGEEAAAAATGAAREHDTRDELGLGSIRNGLAELFFPGTSTLQTRARYFLFVPWMYLEVERGRVSSRRAAERVKEDEVRLMEALRANGQGQSAGVIGQVAGAGLRRFPSSIYWAGLGRWGIRRTRGTQGRYHRSLDGFYERRQERLRFEDGGTVEAWAEANWDPGLPAAPEGFPEGAGFALREEEGAYLRERVARACPGSLVAALAAARPGLQSGGGAPAAGQVWEDARVREGGLDQAQQAWIGHARNFSVGMYGAALLYNLLLGELRGDEGLVAGYRLRMAGWEEEVEGLEGELRGWDEEGFWRLVKGLGRVPGSAEAFCREWLGLARGSGRGETAADRGARELVRAREMSLKGGRSRFTSPRHLAAWSGATGVAPIDYRWGVARRIIEDIARRG